MATKMVIVNLMGAWSNRWGGALVRSDWLLGCRLRRGIYLYHLLFLL